MRIVACTEKQNVFFVLVLKFCTSYAKVANVGSTGVTSGQEKQWLHNTYLVPEIQEILKTFNHFDYVSLPVACFFRVESRCL
jgi:hypothetical protein